MVKSKNCGRFYNELLKIRQTLKENKICYDSSAFTACSSLYSSVNICDKPAQALTDKEKSEAQLQLTSELFFKIFQYLPLLMIVTTCDDYRFLAVNEAFIQSTGYTREEVMNQASKELNFLPRDEVIRFKSLFSQGITRNFELNILTKTREMRSLNISIEYVIFNNQQCLLWEMIDLTEIKSLQQEMARLDQLNMVGEMAASIGHEIRNPITTARGFLQMLGVKPECMQYKEYFDLIIEELDRANTIVTEFLSMAQIKSNNFKNQNLNNIIETLLPLIKADGLIRDISIETSFGKVPDLPLIEKEIRQLILNLVRNAMESMTSSGTIKIKTYQEESETVLSVADQGVGIKPELISKLGSPFITTKEHGTGLGLTICYSIATRHKAVINIDTGSGGTTFYIRFKNPQDS